MGKLFILSVEEDDLETVEKIMAFIVFWQGQFIELTPMEFDVFHLLARRPGRVFSQREIYELVAPDSFDSSWTGSPVSFTNCVIS